MVLYLSLVLVKYIGMLTWKWQHRIFLAVKGCAWQYLVWWGEAVHQNCCWFPKHLCSFASSMPWSLWLLFGSGLPGSWLCITFPVSCRACGTSVGAAAPVPVKPCGSAATFPLQQEAAGTSACPRAARAESNACWLPVLDTLTIPSSSPRSN